MIKQFISLNMKNKLKQILPPFFFKRSYFSQNAEDILLQSILLNDKDCFYVDVGCNHPFHDNNTHLFYKKGWRGINIDPQEHVISIFNRWRKRDVNIMAAVSPKKGSAVCWSFTQNTLTTLDEDVAKRVAKKGVKLVEKLEVQTLPLREIFNERLPEAQRISFLSVDVEGIDLQVLQSNDWEKYRPKCVLVEINDLLPEDFEQDPIVSFLKTVGFVPYGNTVNNWVFVDSRRFVKKLHSNYWWSDELAA